MAAVILTNNTVSRQIHASIPRLQSYVQTTLVRVRDLSAVKESHVAMVILCVKMVSARPNAEMLNWMLCKTKNLEGEIWLMN